MPKMIEVRIRNGDGKDTVLVLPVEETTDLDIFNLAEGEELSEMVDEADTGDSLEQGQRGMQENDADDLLGEVALSYSDFSAATAHNPVEGVLSFADDETDSAIDAPGGKLEGTDLAQAGDQEFGYDDFKFDIPAMTPVDTGDTDSDSNFQNDDTVVGLPDEPHSGVRIVVDTGSAVETTGEDQDEVISADELDGIEDFDDANTIDEINRRVEQLAVDAQSRSATPVVNAPTLIIHTRNDAEPTPLQDGIDGEDADSAPQMIAVEDDEDPEEANQGVDAITRKKLRAQRMQGVIALAVLVLLAGGLLYFFFGRGGSAPVKRTSKQHSITINKKLTPQKGYSTAEFARFCKAATSWPTITLSSTTPVSTVRSEFYATAHAIGTMTANARASMVPLMSSIALTDGKMATILESAGYQVSKVPASSYATLQQLSGTLNNDIAQLNAVVKKC